MLSNRISSIVFFIMSVMTENPTAKDVKFWLRAILLINSAGASVIVLVARNLAVLQITAVCNFLGFSVIAVKNIVFT